MHRTAMVISAPVRSSGTFERARLWTTAKIRATAFAALIDIARAVIAWARTGWIGWAVFEEHNNATVDGRKARCVSIVMRL